MFSMLPGNQLQAPVLAAELARRIGRQPFVVIAGEDHDSRSFLAELRRSLPHHGLAPQFQFTYREADASLADLLRRALHTKPAAAVLIADAHNSARLVREFRSAEFSGEIFANSSAGRRRFLQEAGPAAEGILFPLLVEPGEKRTALEAAFQQRFKRSPDFAAVSTYDAVQLLVAALRKAGLNRARIGDALRELSPWEGAAGTVRWDTLGGNTRPVRLGTIACGQIQPLDAARPVGAP
jgi:ABC-type branched-subunit amino acid transport system substrate-binding protein